MPISAKITQLDPACHGVPVLTRRVEGACRGDEQLQRLRWRECVAGAEAVEQTIHERRSMTAPAEGDEGLRHLRGSRRPPGDGVIKRNASTSGPRHANSADSVARRSTATTEGGDRRYMPSSISSAACGVVHRAAAPLAQAEFVRPFQPARDMLAHRAGGQCGHADFARAKIAPGRQFLRHHAAEAVEDQRAAAQQRLARGRRPGPRHHGGGCAQQIRHPVGEAEAAHGQRRFRARTTPRVRPAPVRRGRTVQ